LFKAAPHDCPKVKSAFIQAEPLKKNNCGHLLMTDKNPIEHHVQQG
jgi:hypothetical protein